MSLNALFEKPVDRFIEGVIKADDESSLRLELEEYVLTNEVQKRLESFFDSYNNYAGANGVWISGFFGSGKSHLLKMLALLLENRSVDGTQAAELFLPKCDDNEILRGELQKTAAIPSKSILFNIDQKADVISKKQVDALLAVFVKVFDESCGYYGKQGHIARFERDLDSRNHFKDFKSAYQDIASNSWETGREQALLEASNIAKAYAKVTGADEADAKGILDNYRKDYSVSIEDFAEQVSDYLDKQSPNFRLNFFVDEVGQYIANNVKLMTNLQTIAESLATKCQGRAWVLVTSQNDMTSVLGEMNQQQSNDFSKIMARFATKMLLTSTNVAEVIQKRLLTKTEQSLESLSALYEKHSGSFGTLFGFTDGSREYKVYRDREAFIDCYPFVPYQFELFQSAIENLSSHNAFEGKHSSVGERSMLGVFQQVAKQLGDHELGQLATFDLMYEGLHTALKSQTQNAVPCTKNTAVRSAPCSDLLTVHASTKCTEIGKRLSIAILSYPTNLNCFNRRSRTCPVTTHSKANTVRWVSDQCSASSSRWQSSLAITSSDSSRHSTLCMKACTLPSNHKHKTQCSPLSDRLAISSLFAC